MRKILLSLAILFFLAPSVTMAACPPPCSTGVACDPITCQPTSPSTICNPSTEADTALGCIPTSPEGLVKWVLKYGILMGGGIAFLLSVWGGATILLSAGNPEKLNQGKEVITSAISGLLFIILSVFLLRLIGVDILGLPDFVK